MKKYMLIGLLLSFLNLSQAAEHSIAIEPFLQSYHWDRDKGYNETHKHVGLVYRYDQFELGVATMINSHDIRSNSVYIGYREKLYETEDLELGFFMDGGYRSGYHKKVLGYVGLYSEYKDFYIKVAANQKTYRRNIWIYI